jgi:methylthioribose-1-phosphate isomerase
MTARTSAIQTLAWHGDEFGFLRMIDQTCLPGELVYLDCRNVDTVFEAIRSLRVRGAPAIGIAAAYGLVIGLQQSIKESNEAFSDALNKMHDYLASSRPTAVNLFWALARMKRLEEAVRAKVEPAAILPILLREARAIHEEDRAMCHAIGKHGAALLKDGAGVLTHCNAGGLATAEYGTALSMIFTAQDQGKTVRVFVDETRPLLQGARLTAWELVARGIDATLICDNMAGQVMREGRIQAVVVGADRITAAGDAANKIGTYSVAVLAKAHQIPFYVAAPTSTFDLSLITGDAIPIEQRSSKEITHGFGKETAPEGVKVYNPAFDVTPAHLITAIVTEKGVIAPVNEANVRRMVGGV